TIMATIQRINIIGSREGSRNRRRLKANQTGKKFRVGIKSNISTNRNNLISGVDRCIHLNAMKKSKEIQYLNAKGALTYTDIAGDPVLYGNLPPREISMKDVFRSGDSSKKFKIAEGQWYRYAPSYVSPAYHLLEGFPF